MSDLMKYNAILPKDDDYHLWYDSLKGWRLNIRGIGNTGFNEEAEILFEIERERIIKLLEEYFEAWFALENPNAYDTGRVDGLASAVALIKGENK